MIVSNAIPSASAVYANALFTGLPKSSFSGLLQIISQFSTSETMRVSIVNGSNDAGIVAHYDGKAATSYQWYGVLWYLAE